MADDLEWLGRERGATSCYSLHGCWDDAQMTPYSEFSIFRAKDLPTRQDNANALNRDRQVASHPLAAARRDMTSSSSYKQGQPSY